VMKQAIKPYLFAVDHGVCIGQVEESLPDRFRLKGDTRWYRFHKHQTKYEPPAVGTWVEITAGHSRHVITLEVVEAEQAKLLVRLFWTYPPKILAWMVNVVVPALQAGEPRMDLPPEFLPDLLAWRRTHPPDKALGGEAEA
jgi:hypothetical protein